ncbi:MAG: ABC transporter ATP-binding protein [Caldiserica bacterium]|nr:ABC transporter ATP-binding protein [Caldisericota bacterium]MDH7563184.1 ABC transporter ATP-binding protein [Caldisericota bacterium]
MEGIVKRFPGVLANDHVDFEVKAGEVHALLGENGAGKTTLMSILAGIYRLDAGQIFINGRKVQIKSPRDAIKEGVGMIHQNFLLVNSHSVAENITLGYDRPKFFMNRREIEKEIKEIGEKFGLFVDPKAKIWQLSVGEQQRVEILKMLFRGAKILVMDEPTAVLTPQEVNELFSTLRSMAQAGHAVVFISHKLDEVMRISDRVTVLRKGKKVATLNTRDTTPNELARLMVGREVFLEVKKTDHPPGEKILQVSRLEALSDKGLPALKGINLIIHSGEILGIAGVAGNGQRELAEVICGLRPARGGKILICGKDLTSVPPRKVIEEKVAYIPEDRKGMGTVGNLSVLENLVLKDYRRSPFSSGAFLNLRQLRQHASTLVEKFQIQTPKLETPAKLLSGGNIQRLILAREISCSPKLLVAVHPTRGLDVSATESVHRMLLEQRESGAAILLISEDLDELTSLSDWLAVIYEGEIMGIVDPRKASLEDIGLMMAGKKRQTPQEAVIEA